MRINLDNTTDERINFSERLRRLLKQHDYDPKSCTKLASEFNVRYAGNSITVHAARKWLVAESIPAQDKLRTLAKWLGVSAEWLRYGTGSEEAKQVQTTFDEESVRLVADVKRLPPKHRKLARDFVRMLSRHTS